MKAVLDLLLSLSSQCPPYGAERHTLTLSDEGGLTVNLAGKDGWRSVVVEPRDLERDPFVLAAQIVVVASCMRAGPAKIRVLRG